MATIASPAEGAVPFASTVGALALPVALERLFRTRATGVLTLEARTGKHIVFVRDGYPVSVELPGSFEMIGKILVDMKLIDDATYQSTLAYPPPEGQRYGDQLVARGIVTEDQLRQALKAQVRRKLHRLFFLTDSSIEYVAQGHTEGLQRNEPLRVHPWRAYYHGVRSAWNADRLRQSLVSIASKPIRTKLTAEELARFGLGADDGRAAALLRDQPFTMDALAAVSGLQMQPVSALCYALYIAGALQDEHVESVSGAYVRVRQTPQQTPQVSATSQGEARVPSSARAAALPAPARPVGAHAEVKLPPSTSATAQGIPSAAAMELEKLVEQRKATIDEDDLFKVLGLGREATPEQIKVAYLDGARRYHPDRLAALGLQRLRPDVEQIFRRLSEAQSVLLDDTRRKEYIAALDKPKPTAEDAAAHREVVNALEAEVAFRRGQTSLRRNDLSTAMRDFQQALDLQPKEGEHVIYVAWVRHCLGELDVAQTRAELQRGQKLSPRAASAHYYLGMLLKEEEMYDAAKTEFKRAVALDERQFEAAQEIRILETRRGKPEKKSGIFDMFRKK